MINKIIVTCKGLFLMATAMIILAGGFIAYPLLLGKLDEINGIGFKSSFISLIVLLWFIIWGVWFMYKGVETVKKERGKQIS